MPKVSSISDKSVAIIGGGPSGLMAAEVLSQAGIKVNVYDAMPSVGRKFLLAGKGGLNITHSEPFQDFLSRYGAGKSRLQPMLERFSANQLRDWAYDLGIRTFVGSSGRIFPEEMKAAPLLRAWLHRLRQQDVKFHVRHKWLGWHQADNKKLRFQTPEGIREIEADAVILALGGGSWPQLGSTGEWVEILVEKGIRISPLLASNCGFNVNWSDYFRLRFAGHPLKSIAASVDDQQLKGDCTITDYGIEGGIIYTLSSTLRDEIIQTGFATLLLDLKPDYSLDTLIDKVSKPHGKQSMSNHLRKTIGIDGVKAGLLREKLTSEDFNNPIKLCSTVKALPIQLLSARPLAEAISSAGGVAFEAIDENLMIVNLPGVFCAGEMLDWEAPTGGYLLTACFASGRASGEGVLNWLQSFIQKNH
ncbi:MAG: TIGR03862 family flavoprotein [Methylococcaceae bacterium]|nr:TIGR03862 family flavoprotein [Methylococcaceae bacterium]